MLLGNPAVLHCWLYSSVLSLSLPNFSSPPPCIFHKPSIYAKKQFHHFVAHTIKHATSHLAHSTLFFSFNTATPTISSSMMVTGFAIILATMVI